jgi:hypothetical protein
MEWRKHQYRCRYRGDAFALQSLTVVGKASTVNEIITVPT